MNTSVQLKYPIVLTIAGSDSSGGAGIQADLKTIQANGCYGASAITALTAQNTTGVQGIYPVEPQFILEQCQSVLSDLDVGAVKIGMLHNNGVISAVVEALANYSHIPVVIDPVMVAKGGACLLNMESVDLLKTTLFAKATIITPNIPEAEYLLNNTISTEADMENAAKTLASTYDTAILLKGGHLASDNSSDYLYCPMANSGHWYKHTRINGKNTHGTGCTLSAAIASKLAQGKSLQQSVQQAISYIQRLIAKAQAIQIGKGHGPLVHYQAN